MFDIFGKVEDFNMGIIGIDRTSSPGPIEDQEELGFFVGTLHEEIEEFETACRESDFVGQIDALQDLIYFAAGGMVRMGIKAKVSNKIFSAIHDANMTKKKGKKQRDNGSHELDAIKPEGWVSPEERIATILDRYVSKGVSRESEDGFVPGAAPLPCGEEA